MVAQVSPYFGAPNIQALQRRRDAQVAALTDLPGAVIHARVFTSDAPDVLGWDRLREAMADEGIVSLRGVDTATVAQGHDVFRDFQTVLHTWDLFMADADRIRAVCGPIARHPLPDGLVQEDAAALTPERVHAAQAFMAEQGVSPFSADALTGRLFPARLLVLAHADGRVAATGFAGMTHNRHSPFAGIAWVGLIAVDPDLRGIGLGKTVDAAANLMAVEDLGAEGSMEFVARDNVPSRRMLESCGLTHVADRSVVIFSTSGDRITR